MAHYGSIALFYPPLALRKGQGADHARKLNIFGIPDTLIRSGCE